MLSLNREESLMVRAPVDLKSEHHSWCGSDARVTKYSLTWTVHHFHRAVERDRCITSPHFQLGPGNELEAYIVLFPNGDAANVSDDHVAVYLQFASIHDSNMRAKLRFGLSAEVGSRQMNDFNVKELVIERASMCQGLGWGFQKFCSRSSLKKMHGSLTLVCEVCLATPSPPTVAERPSPDMKLITDFGSLYETGKFTDLTIVVSGARLRVHKAVLFARSPVFAAMLDADMEEQASSCINITDLELSVVEELLNFLYTSRLDNLGLLAETLLSAADKYAVEDLRDLCADHLSNNITVENAARIFVLADLHNARQLRCLAINFIMGNRSKVVETEGWKQVKQVHSLTLLEALVEY